MRRKGACRRVLSWTTDPPPPLGRATRGLRHTWHTVKLECGHTIRVWASEQRQFHFTDCPALDCGFQPSKPDRRTHLVKPLPQFYECGICGAWHSATWDGDCREDAARHFPDDLDVKYGPNGWESVAMPGTEGNTP